jgi:S1-C subfamily serine protease
MTRRLRFRILALAAAGVIAAVAATLGVARARAGTIGTGLVVVDTTLGYEGASAEGTGLVLTPGGEVLTNNHVIRGATTIRVVVPGTGKRYAARVVGYDVGDDVAVLQLEGASNLRTVSAGSAAVRVGQAVTATGNAGGTGNLTTVKGVVTGLRRSIVAGDGQGDSERLTGLIETNAAVVAGDSGGALLDSGGHVIGMLTAASTSNQFSFQQAAASDAYAIPVAKALSIAHTITRGTTTAAVHVGGTAFLGVSIATAGQDGFGFGDGSQSGAAVTGVAGTSPAGRAGLQAGDVIVRLDGRPVVSAGALRSRLVAKRPGQKVTIGYVDEFGSSQTVTVTLASGPPQ